jgi:hypothetical protein
LQAGVLAKVAVVLNQVVGEFAHGDARRRTHPPSCDRALQSVDIIQEGEVCCFRSSGCKMPVEECIGTKSGKE